MAAQVVQPQKKQTDYSAIGTLIGTGVGAYYGGPGGAQQGAGLGGAIGGAANQFNQQSQSQNTLAQAPQQEAAASSPLLRRKEAIQSDPATQMREGKIALAAMDEETRKAFEPTLDEGLRRYAAQRRTSYSTTA